MSKEIINDCTFVFWECVDFDYGTKSFDFFLKYYPPEVYLLLGISMVEVKPVVTGKDVVKTEINQNHQDANAMINIKVFANESSSEIVGFPNGTFLKKWKPKIRRSRGTCFQSLRWVDISFSFWNFVTVFFLMKIRKSIILKQKGVSEKYVFDCGFDRKKYLSYGEKQVRWWRSNSKSESFWNFWWTGFCRIFVFIFSKLMHCAS